MTGTSFLEAEELETLGLGSYGKNVLISRYCRMYNPGVIHFGHHVRIDDYCILSGGEGIHIGNYVHIAAYCALYGAGGITMEDFTCLSGRVIVYSISDDFSGNSLTNPMIPDQYKPGLTRAPVYLCKHAIVGTGSTILPGVFLAEGAAVGAHSLVKDDCEPWIIYGGTPVRPLRRRTSNIIELEKKMSYDNSEEAEKRGG